MNFNPGTFRYNEVELLRAGEVADTGVSDVGGFVSGDDIVPDAHLRARKWCVQLFVGLGKTLG